MQDQTTNSGSPSSHPKIRFSTSTPLGVGGSATGGGGRDSASESASPASSPTPAPTPTPVAAYDGAPATTIVASSKIRTNERSMDHGGGKFSRKPNSNGTGAIHVRTFHSKLNDESLAYLDQQINEWLDQHPEYEVKFSVSTIGMYTGKVKEPAVICQVWV